MHACGKGGDPMYASIHTKLKFRNWENVVKEHQGKEKLG